MKILTPQILAMYLGCEIQTTLEDVVFKLVGVRETEFGEWVADLITTNLSIQGRTSRRFDIICTLKPILRNLSSMTEDEAMELFDIVVGSWDGGVIKSRRLATSIEVCCYDIEEDDNPSDDEIFEFADSAENLMRIQLKPTFNIWKGWEHDYNEVYDWKTQVDIFAYLLSKSFDLFGLIGSGLAIDKDTLK